MRWNPHVTVAAVIEKDGHFLFVEEKASGNIVINQPAGHWEEHETLVEAVVREVHEETAWRFQPKHVTGIYHWVNPANQHTFLRFCFCGQLLDHDDDAALDPDILRTLWLSYDDMVNNMARHRSPLVQTCIDDYLTGHRYNIDLLQHIISK